MLLDDHLGALEQARDLLVAQALHDVTQDLDLTLGEAQCRQLGQLAPTAGAVKN